MAPFGVREFVQKTFVFNVGTKWEKETVVVGSQDLDKPQHRQPHCSWENKKNLV